MGIRSNARAGADGTRACAPATRGDISYRSSQWMIALWLILPLAAALVIAVSWNAPPRWAPALASVATAGPLLILGRLVVEIQDAALHWRYGFLGWPRWHVAIAEIVEIKLSRGPALHAGIQFNGRQRVFTASLGSPALELTLAGGRRILLGSPEPERLAQFIRARLPEPR